MQNGVAALLPFVLVGNLRVPPIRYLSAGWNAKRKDILDGLNEDARLAYFGMFSRCDQTPIQGNPITMFLAQVWT